MLGRLKPKFWDHLDVAAGPYKHMFNFRRIWKLAVLLTAGVALMPLIFITIIDYGVTQQSIESEVFLRTSRLVSNTRRTISFSLQERKFALDFITRDNSFETLNDPARLEEILENLKKAFGGGFADLGVIDPLGYQRTYVGPYNLVGKDYSDQDWYKEVLDRGVYISDVFLGYRQVPHFVIAVKHALGSGLCYVLRATLDTERFSEFLSNPEMDALGDVFVINHKGVLQTPSRDHGEALKKIPLSVPKYSSHTEVLEATKPNGEALVVGYAYIDDTPFILMMVKERASLMKPWHKTRLEIIGFLAISIAIILLVILWVATFLVNNIYEADQKRVTMLHQVEYSNKMATIGRLAAGVAHEINNPLAIINEKAGLIKDLLLMKKQYALEEKLVALVDSVTASTDRCATITRRLLSFMRPSEVTIKPLNLKGTISEVLGFLGKEAEYRSIAVSVQIPDDMAEIESDRARLQEVFLNIINNAFAAVNDGGHVHITAKSEDERFFSVTIADDGGGIPEEDLNRVFEPFFSTKTSRGGTGLGLSITSGLVQDLGGEISVRSTVGKGTGFTVKLPFKVEATGSP